MTAKAQISIVVPTHNRRDAVIKLVHSLSRQSGVSVQLVVVVDGSTDGTLQALADCGLSNLEVVHHSEPRGVSAARNAGLARAEAEYVGFIDDDDFWSPNRAWDAVESLRSDSHGAAWSSCGAANIDGQMKVIGLEPAPCAEAVSEDLYRCNVLPGGGSAIVARTELVRAAGGFSSEFADLADWDLWFRLIRLSPLAIVPKYQIAYTVDVRSRSHTRATTSLEELTRLRAKYRFGVAGNADFDPEIWNRWVFRLHLRARDRLGMSRLRFGEAVRTRNPLDLARSAAHLMLPVDAQLMIRNVSQRRWIRTLGPVDVQTIETWLSEVDDMPVTSPG